MTLIVSVRIGVLGAAKIVPSALIRPARNVTQAQVVAIAARGSARAAAFAKRHNIPRVHTSYAALLDDPDVDAIYNPLPNGLHCEWTVRALRAGKHVLCEKPFAANTEEAERMKAVADETGLVLSEAFAYWHHPLTTRMKEIVASGEIGTIEHINAEFSFFLPLLRDIRYRFDLAGGATMDAGCYPVSLVRLLAGAEPTVVSAHARTIFPQIDYAMRADLKFDDGRTGGIQCTMLSPRLYRSRVKVRGDAGELRVTNPYHPHWFHSIQVRTRQGTRRENVARADVYECQLRAFVRAIREGAPVVTDGANGVANMRVIDSIYEHAGLNPRGT